MCCIFANSLFIYDPSCNFTKPPLCGCSAISFNIKLYGEVNVLINTTILII